MIQTQIISPSRMNYLTKFLLKSFYFFNKFLYNNYTVNIKLSEIFKK
jgi:hypothetical protein